MTPKAARNPKLGVILAKCAPMTPYPLLAQPLCMTIFRAANLTLDSTEPILAMILV